MSTLDPLLISSKPALTLPARIIEPDVNFREKFEFSSFSFNHNLAGHPLFEIPRLVELANTLLSKGGVERVRCQLAEVSFSQKWHEIPQIEQVVESITHIEESGSSIVFYNVQLDPEYKALLDRIMAELEELIDIPLHQEITWLDAYILMASPYSVTPYHIDHESTFLCQVHGEREVHLFNQRDRQVLTETEIEEYYRGNTAAANYKPENQCKASIYHLTSGKGVHHPSLAPHYYKNGSHYSVAFTIHFCLRSRDLNARIYQVNHLLCKLGLPATPPGESAVIDNLKIFVIGLLAKRHPRNKFELLRSGIVRLVTFMDSVRQIVRGFKR